MGQTTTDTLFVYETIVVYDTIKVYDTLKVEYKKELNSNASETFFKNNNSAQNAVLVIDTANQKAQLVLFNKNDTATISISNIILSETNKNLETMKKEILTFATAAIVAQAAFAQKNTTDSLFLEKKYAVGAGVTFKGDGIGGTVKFDYLKTKKLSFGLRSNVTSNKWRDMSFSGSNEPGFEYPGYTLHFTGGHIINGFLTTTYNFKKEGYASKLGLYVVGGLGYQDFKMSGTTNYTDPQYDHSSVFSYKTFLGLICFGGDYKVGPGKVFLDIPIALSIYEQYKNEYVFKTQPSRNGSFKSNYWAIPEVGFVALNIGYTLYI